MLSFGAAPAANLGYEVADSPHTAPGWRVVGEDFYTCVEPVQCPLDPKWVRQVHEFDPGAVFMWRKQQYLPPGAAQPVTVTHNALGRYVPTPRRELQLFYVEMPDRPTHQKPNELVIVWERFDDCYFQEGGPGAFMPWSDTLTDYLRRDYLKDYKTVQEVHEGRRDRHLALLETRARLNDDRKRAWDDLNAWCARQLDKPGDTRAGFLDYMRKTAAPREAKPMVFLGGM